MRYCNWGFMYAWTIEQRVYEETEKHIETLSYRMKKVGEEALIRNADRNFIDQ